MFYFLLKWILYPLGILPRWALCALSDVLSFAVYRIVGYRKKVMLDNLQRCFPQKTEQELHSIARGVYRTICDLALNILRIRFASAKRVMRTVRYVNPEVLLNSEGRNGIVLAAHYSCWEYIGSVQRYIPNHQTVAAYQPLRGAMERIIVEGRMRFGAVMAPLKAVFRTIFERHNKGQNTYTLMVTDQSPSADAQYGFLTFLGQRTSVFDAPERIARKINSITFYLRVREIRRFYYEYEFVKLSENAAGEPPLAIMQRFFAELEKDILQYPHLWLWTHKRWKNAVL